VCGGQVNTASASGDTVGGGLGNTAGGGNATVPGGSNNTALGAVSFAAGRRAKAKDDGSFVWGDSTDADVSSSGINQFLARASGGVIFFSSSDLSTGVKLPAGGGAWSSLSDRGSKENFRLVDGKELLAKLSRVPLLTWNYRSQSADVRHIGPTAQDFRAAFGLGEDEKHISTIDAEGIALAGVQELYRIIQEKDRKIASFEEKLKRLEQRLAQVEDQKARRGVSTENLNVR